MKNNGIKEQNYYTHAFTDLLAEVYSAFSALICNSLGRSTTANAYENRTYSETVPPVSITSVVRRISRKRRTDETKH